jgi:hypothetical protein
VETGRHTSKAETWPVGGTKMQFHRIPAAVVPVGVPLQSGNRPIRVNPSPNVGAGSEINGVVCRFMTHPPTPCASCMGQGEIVGVCHGSLCSWRLASDGGILVSDSVGQAVAGLGGTVVNGDAAGSPSHLRSSRMRRRSWLLWRGGVPVQCNATGRPGRRARSTTLFDLRRPARSSK